MDGFAIRLATDANIPVLLHQRRCLFEETSGLSPAKIVAIVAAFEPYVRRALPEGTYRAYIAETSEHQAVAGAGVMTCDRLGPQCAYLCNVYTEPEYRRRGLARRLLEDLLAWCRAKGLTMVDVHASGEGRTLYADLGFAPTNEMRLILE